MICQKKGCRKKATAFFYGKQYCNEHQIKEKEKEKYENIYKNCGVCSVKGCNRVLGHLNKYGMCNYHKQLDKLRIRAIEQKKACDIALGLN